MAKTNDNILGGAKGDLLNSGGGGGGSSGSIFSGMNWGQIAGGAGDVISGLGSAFSSYQAMQGAKAEASTYAQAAELAGQDVMFQEESTNIQKVQARREELKSFGATRAEVGGAGFSTESSTAQDILGMSASQGALTQAMIGVQGAIKETGYRQQQIAYLGEEQAAKAAAKSAEGGMFGGILKAAAGVAMMLL